jgi:hypothetical protein
MREHAGRKSSDIEIAAVIPVRSFCQNCPASSWREHCRSPYGFVMVGVMREAHDIKSIWRWPDRRPDVAYAKIQSICNGKLPPIAMQRLERARKKPPAREQWETMKRTMRKTMENNADWNGYLAEVVTAGTKEADCRRRAVIDIARISPNGFVLHSGQFGLPSLRHARGAGRRRDLLPRELSAGTGMADAGKNSPCPDRHFSIKRGRGQEHSMNIETAAALSSYGRPPDSS